MMGAWQTPDIRLVATNNAARASFDRGHDGRRWLVGAQRPRQAVSAMMTLVLVVLGFAGPHRPVRADTSPDVASGTVYREQVEPLLRRHCYRCHGGKQRAGGLDLTDPGAARGTADSGEPVIVPGDPEASLLIRRLVDDSWGDIMPRDAPALTSTEIDQLRRWIRDGAPWEHRSDTGGHWAYRPPTRPGLPEVAASDWPINAIDYFILARLEDVGYGPLQQASPERLLRRVYLALIGIPPTPTQLAAFVRDPSPTAYEQVVDQLLNSPHYGERWARHWLDLARYADSNGYQADQLRDSWAYRDWVIRAFNRDLPFDRFVVEQLAGDLLPDATLAQRIATGFHRTVTCNVEAGVHPEQNRVNQVFDRVNTTGTVFLGTTLECAQCHDHKYDPFTQRDYYRLFAYFNNTPLEVELQAGVRYDFVGPTMQIPATHGAGPVGADEAAPVSTLVMVEMSEPRATHVMQRGNYLDPGEAVACGTPARLHRLRPGAERNRLGLAEWLVDRRNPLLARVTVNRWWSELWGRGLVTTLEDFGSQAEPPTHPHLLDWLAVEFMDHGWSIKHIHKLMVMSAAFRQTAYAPEVTARDPDNVWYGRGPRFRLPAETVRDNGLAVSGLLSRRMYGPPVMPYQPPGIWRAVGRNQPKWQTAGDEDRFRRGIYVIWKRAAPYPSFVNFDAPDRAACTVQRPRTNTPLQALTLLNDPAYAEMAVALARRMMVESGGTAPRTLIDYGFRLCTSRPPRPEEVDILEELYMAERDKLCRAPDRAEERLAEYLVAQPESATLDRVRWAAWTAVANAMLNLDETISL